MKYEITLDKNLLDNKDIDFFHYEQTYELAKCELGTFYITSLGELKCEFTNEEKGIQTRNYNDIVRYYIRNNEMYSFDCDISMICLLGYFFGYLL